MQTIATLGKAPLAHLWPAGGLTNFTIDTPLNLVILGIVKLLAISFTVHGGFRGGYIFPAMAAGAAFGRAVSLLLPVPPAIAVLCTAAGVTVAITRTVFATTIILTALSGEVNAASPVLAASLGAAFATFYMPFIGSQRAREDRFDAQIHYRTFEVRGGGRVGGGCRTAVGGLASGRRRFCWYGTPGAARLAFQTCPLGAPHSPPLVPARLPGRPEWLGSFFLSVSCCFYCPPAGYLGRFPAGGGGQGWVHQRWRSPAWRRGGRAGGRAPVALARLVPRVGRDG